MLQTLRNLFAPPIFEDEEKTRSATYVNAVALINIPILILFLIIRLVVQRVQLFGTGNLVVMGLITVMIIAWLLGKNGFVKTAAVIQVSIIWLASTVLALVGGGIRSTGYVSYFVAMLMAGLLLGLRPAIGIAIISSLSGFGLAYAEKIGFISYPADFNPNGSATELTVLFAFSTVFMYLTINSLQSALKNAKANASELELSNQQLANLRDALELRVQERTAALEKQTTQLQTVSSVARTIASVQDIDALLPGITKLVSGQFGFYHSGIFLLDETNEFAVLRASNSSGGSIMLDRQHKLILDENSIVGFVTSRGEPRIALDVGTDAVFFSNPDLPDTRSEMALPLNVGGRVIGALDVQSTQPNAFTDNDIAILTTLADQVAIAIENARLFSETRSALSASQESFADFIKQEWSDFARQSKNTGYLFDGNRTIAMEKRDNREKVKSLAQTGRLSLEKESAELAIPIKFRGQTVGILDVKSKKGNRQWTPDEITLLEAAAERAAFALENARLVESSERRASRERAIGDISSKIGAVSDLEAIMQTAVEELGRKIGSTAEVTLELSNEED